MFFVYGNRMFKFILIIVCASLLSTTVGITQETSEQKYPRGAQYFLGKADELLIKVNIWGFVNKPGQFLVPSDTDLISLISYAGGPREGAKLSTIKLVRTFKDGSVKEKIIKINVDKYLKNANESLIPQLMPDDTIVISGSKWYHINSFLEFVTKIAVLVQIYSWVVYYSGR